MMIRRHLTRISLAGALCASALPAQSSMVVLTLPASARAAGGGDVSPFATDASALFYGAQRLPRERTGTVSAGTWIGDAQLATLAFATPVRWQRRAESVLALGVQSLDYGSAEEMVPDPLTGGRRGTPTGNRVGGNELALTLGLKQQSARLRLGVALTYMRQQVADLSASALTFSGANGITVRGWDVDLSVEHASSSSRNPARRTLTIPSTWRASLATPAWMLSRTRWRGIVEWRRANHIGSTAVVGAEGAYRTAAGWELQVRGAGLSYSDETARAPWSAGGSAARGAWSLDYAYQGFGAFGAVHRMGVTWRSRDPRNSSR
ncbi:MAG: hypothetical protein Q8K55_05160 [Gemmatimonadaceae bacterium]|nr:hypothetical protein [Gemmatimonadaceae bacterium]